MPALEQSLAASFRRVADAQVQVEAVMKEFNRAPAAAKASMVRLLGLSASPRSLELVRASLRHPEPVVRDAAVRTLCSWPDPSPAEDLLELARSLQDGSEKALALRGYVRMAGLSNDPMAEFDPSDNFCKSGT